MKKLHLSLIIVFLLGSSVASGQAALLVLIFGEKAASENFYFSLKAGLNYSMISGVDQGKNRIGGNFGLINNIRITDDYFLTPEFIALSPRGVRGQPVLNTGNPELDSLLSTHESSDRRLSYIDIPVLLKRNLGKRWAISAGPQFSFLTGATDTYFSKPIAGTELTTEVDISEEIAKMDVAAVLDISYVVSEGKKGKGMNLFFRVSRGFIDMNKNSDRNPAYNTTFQFGASFPFIEVQSEP